MNSRHLSPHQTLSMSIIYWGKKGGSWAPFVVIWFERVPITLKKRIIDRIERKRTSLFPENRFKSVSAHHSDSQTQQGNEGAQKPAVTSRSEQKVSDTVSRYVSTLSLPTGFNGHHFDHFYHLLSTSSICAHHSEASGYILAFCLVWPWPFLLLFSNGSVDKPRKKLPVSKRRYRASVCKISSVPPPADLTAAATHSVGAAIISYKLQKGETRDIY